MVYPESFTVRKVQPQDIAALRPLLETWIKDSETGQVIAQEVDASLAAMEAFSQGEDSSRLYVVAEGAGGAILGVMGLTDASDTLEAASPSVARGNASELINAFVDPNTRGQGVGTALARDLEFWSRTLAYDDILVTSDPRYKDTGWPFWQSLYGEPALIVPDAYGPGDDAPVWRKSLAK